MLCYTMSKQLGDERPVEERGCGKVYVDSRGTRGQARDAGRRMRRACTGTPVHHEHTVREEDAAGAYRYTSTL
jgi:hypothetical protein